MMEKLNRFQKALAGQSGNLGDPRGSTERVKQLVESLKLLPRRWENEDGFNPARILPGPLYGTDCSAEAYTNAIGTSLRIYRSGQRHKGWEKTQDDWAKRDSVLGQDPRSTNIVEPRVMISDTEIPFLTNVVVIANADDAERIARAHTKKQPNFTPIFFQSLIATNDNEHWKRQRNYFGEVFLPKMSLSRIFKISRNRAEKCADILGRMARNQGKNGVQMHEFFLHEAQAQLQLALFGLDEEFMEDSNKKIRDVFAGINPDLNYGRDICLEMMRKVDTNPAFAVASDPEVVAGKKSIFGPLSKSVAKAAKDLNLSLEDQFGNMMLILFAGHDTTAHTMTWFAYEMAKNPRIQQRLHQECDQFFERLNGRPMEYEDCDYLPFLTRCAMETLRLWTAVPNGTFRELQFEETVIGPGGKEVYLPKGTYVQIQNWTRHRNPNLWGLDAHLFNPDREFRDDEIWGGETFQGYNPSSRRFSPFTFAPRDCLGKNFAQMEMRTILANVFHKFHFELSDPYKDFDEAKAGYPIENVQGTMGPRDLTSEGIEATERRIANGQQPQMAMYLKVYPRQPKSSL